MQGETELGVKFSLIPNDCENNTSRQICQCRHNIRRVLKGTAIKRRHKFSNTLKRPFWFRRRRSKIKLPTRFLLGGTINDPLNLQSLQNKNDRQSDICSFQINCRVLTPNRLRRIGFPNITDTSDPLNLKNVSNEEQESLSDECMEKSKNAASINYCQVLHTLSFDKSEDNSEQSRLCFDSSADMKEKMSPYSNNLNLNERNQHCVEVSNCSMPNCSINDCNTDDVPVEVACKTTNDITEEHMPSVFSEVDAVACTHSSNFCNRGKIVSPAVPQFSHRRARKRQRQSAHASKETIPPASSSHKSCKKNKEKFPHGNYVAYYGYRNVDRNEDPRLKLLPRELFEGKDVLDIGCNAGIVTIAIASTYLPERILGIDVDQRLIGSAKRNVRRYVDENSYPSCLQTAFGPISTNLLPSTESSAFPHNILFQVVKFLNFTLQLLIYLFFSLA